MAVCVQIKNVVNRICVDKKIYSSHNMRLRYLNCRYIIRIKVDIYLSYLYEQIIFQ